MNQEKVKKIFQNLSKAIPNPTTELVHNSPYELLIATILSAQSTDIGVNKATKILFAVANTPEKVLTLGEKNLKKYIKNIGLYNAKAKNIIKTSQILVDQYNSKIPDNREALEKLPGIGRKTANIILNLVFNKPVIAVDTHVFRVSNRTKLAVGKTPLAIEEKLMKIVPTKFKKVAHHLLILHGRYTCTAKKPKCSECVINKLCEFEHKNFPHRQLNFWG